MNKRIESIDGWRAIAALGVLYTHVWATLSFPVLNIGGIDLLRFLNLWGNGVQLFFVISGFCFYLVLEKQQQYNLRTALAFWKKRWLRIAPAFYTICVIVALVHHSRSAGDILYKLFFNFIFLHNHVKGAEVDAIFWSLAVEWHFYLLLPLIFIVINRAGIIQTISALIVLCFVLNILHYSGLFYPGDQWWYSIFNNIGHFAWGILTGYLFRKNILFGFLTRNYSLVWGLLFAYTGKTLFSSAMLARFPAYAVFLQSAGPLVMTFGFACMIYTSLMNELSFSVIGNKFFSWIGKISYSFYLLHAVVLGQVYLLVRPYLANSPLAVGVLMITTLLVLLPVSYLSYTLLESFYFKRKQA